MECKALTGISILIVSAVLIETLWNVKTGWWIGFQVTDPVLIETLWNVKNTPDFSTIETLLY